MKQVGQRDRPNQLQHLVDAVEVDGTFERVSAAGAFFGPASLVPSKEPPPLVAHQQRCAERPPRAAQAIAAPQLVRSKWLSHGSQSPPPSSHRPSPQPSTRSLFRE